ncbi:MAG: Zn-ribbon domain-containing OB-fold protein [Acidimicrobiia bacterium]
MADLSVPIQPQPTPDTAGFWAATAAGGLALCWCPECRRYRQPPHERCAGCGGPVEFRAVSGRGRIHSYIVVGRAVAPGYQDGSGQVIVLVDLEEQDGLRLVGRLEGPEDRAAEIGAAVEARIVDLPGGDFRVPVFHLAPVIA